MEKSLFRFRQSKPLTPLTVAAAVVAVIVLLGVLAGILFWFSSSKTPVTAEEFAAAAEAHGLTVTEAALTESELSLCQRFLQVSKPGVSDFQLCYYALTDNSTAQAVYSNCKAAFAEEAGNVSSSTNINLGSYGSYTLTTNGTYYFCACLDDTLIAAQVSEDYKAELKDIIRELGY